LEVAVSLNSTSSSGDLSCLRAYEKVYLIYEFECGITFWAIKVGLVMESSSSLLRSDPGSENLIA